MNGSMTRKDNLDAKQNLIQQLIFNKIIHILKRLEVCDQSCKQQRRQDFAFLSNRIVDVELLNEGAGSE